MAKQVVVQIVFEPGETEEQARDALKILTDYFANVERISIETFDGGVEDPVIYFP